MPNATMTQARLSNETIYEDLANGHQKRATDALNDYTRIKLREEGFFSRIMPEIVIGDDELDQTLDGDQPSKIIHKEPDSRAAISVPFGTQPTNMYIRGTKYQITFGRILSPRFTKDVDELRTYPLDIRQILSDTALRDMMAEEDGKFLRAVNAALGTPDTIMPWATTPQWVTIDGGITRENLYEGLKVMPRTASHLNAATVLCNNVTIMEPMKWGREEMGGDFAQDVIKDGWSQARFADVDWVITIKRDLVPDDTLYQFADPKYIGKALALEQVTVFMKRESFMLDFYMYQTKGAAIGNTMGVARVDYA